MNDLIETYRQLSEALAADPLLLLASAVATLDPFWNTGDEDDYDEDPLWIALRVTRGAFPDIYAAAVERLQAGAPSAELDRLICGAITAKGIPLDDLYAIGWGIPLPAFGADLTAPEFYDAHPDLLPLLAHFGIELPDDEYCGAEVPEQAYEIGRALAASLHEQDDPALRQVGWLLCWIFSCTGNSLVDCTDEALSELEPLSWSTDDVAFAIELIAEADGIMNDVAAGLRSLTAVPGLITVLQRNISCLEQRGRKGQRNERHVIFDWSGTDSGADRAAVADSVVLQLRPAAA
jgi:hypothetical protein